MRRACGYKLWRTLHKRKPLKWITSEKRVCLAECMKTEKCYLFFSKYLAYIEVAWKLFGVVKNGVSFVETVVLLNTGFIISQRVCQWISSNKHVNKKRKSHISKEKKKNVKSAISWNLFQSAKFMPVWIVFYKLLQRNFVFSIFSIFAKKWHFILIKNS